MFVSLSLHSGDALSVEIEDGQIILEGHDTYLILSPEDARKLGIALGALHQAMAPKVIPLAPVAARAARAN